MIMPEDKFDERGSALTYHLGETILRFADENGIGLLELVGMLELCKTKFIAISFAIKKP